MLTMVAIIPFSTHASGGSLVPSLASVERLTLRRVVIFRIAVTFRIVAA